MSWQEYISKMGFSDGSPFVDEEALNIFTPNGVIDMSNTGKTLLANGRVLPPYSGLHQFDTNVVRETPIDTYGYLGLNRNEGAVGAGLGVNFSGGWGAKVTGNTPTRPNPYYKGGIGLGITKQLGPWNLSGGMERNIKSGQMTPRFGAKYNFKSGGAVHAKAKILMDEGYDRDQAYAIAYSMQERGELPKAQGGQELQDSTAAQRLKVRLDKDYKAAIDRYRLTNKPAAVKKPVVPVTAPEHKRSAPKVAPPAQEVDIQSLLAPSMEPQTSPFEVTWPESERVFGPTGPTGVPETIGVTGIEGPRYITDIPKQPESEGIMDKIYDGLEALGNVEGVQDLIDLGRMAMEREAVIKPKSKESTLQVDIPVQEDLSSEITIPPVDAEDAFLKTFRLASIQDKDITPIEGDGSGFVINFKPNTKVVFTPPASESYKKGKNIENIRAMFFSNHAGGSTQMPNFGDSNEKLGEQSSPLSILMGYNPKTQRIVFFNRANKPKNYKDLNIPTQTGITWEELKKSISKNDNGEEIIETTKYPGYKHSTKIGGDLGMFAYGTSRFRKLSELTKTGTQDGGKTMIVYKKDGKIQPAIGFWGGAKNLVDISRKLEKSGATDITYIIGDAGSFNLAYVHPDDTYTSEEQRQVRNLNLKYPGAGSYLAIEPEYAKEAVGSYTKGGVERDTSFVIPPGVPHTFQQKRYGGSLPKAQDIGEFPSPYDYGWDTGASISGDAPIISQEPEQSLIEQSAGRKGIIEADKLSRGELTGTGKAEALYGFNDPIFNALLLGAPASLGLGTKATSKLAKGLGKGFDYVNPLSGFGVGRNLVAKSNMGHLKKLVKMRQQGVDMKDFFHNLNWTSDGKTLWNKLNNYNVKVLTGGKELLNDAISIGKRGWAKKNLNLTGDRVIVEKQKELYASSSKILIDDAVSNVEKFRKAGGNAILHTNTKETLKQLNKMIKNNPALKDGIYIDLDGVLVDLASGVNKFSFREGGELPKAQTGTEKGRWDKQLFDNRADYNNYMTNYGEWDSEVTGNNITLKMTPGDRTTPIYSDIGHNLVPQTEEGDPYVDLPEVIIEGLSPETKEFFDNPPSWYKYSEEFLDKNKKNLEHINERKFYINKDWMDLFGKGEREVIDWEELNRLADMYNPDPSFLSHFGLLPSGLPEDYGSLGEGEEKYTNSMILQAWLQREKISKPFNQAYNEYVSEKLIEENPRGERDLDVWYNSFSPEQKPFLNAIGIGEEYGQNKWTEEGWSAEEAPPSAVGNWTGVGGGISPPEGSSPFTPKNFLGYVGDALWTPSDLIGSAMDPQQSWYEGFRTNTGRFSPNPQKHAGAQLTTQIATDPLMWIGLGAVPAAMKAERTVSTAIGTGVRTGVKLTEQLFKGAPAQTKRLITNIANYKNAAFKGPIKYQLPKLPTRMETKMLREMRWLGKKAKENLTALNNTPEHLAHTYTESQITKLYQDALDFLNSVEKKVNTITDSHFYELTKFRKKDLPAKIEETLSKLQRKKYTKKTEKQNTIGSKLSESAQAEIRAINNIDGQEFAGIMGRTPAEMGDRVVHWRTELSSGSGAYGATPAQLGEMESTLDKLETILAREIPEYNSVRAGIDNARARVTATTRRGSDLDVEQHVGNANEIDSRIIDRLEELYPADREALLAEYPHIAENARQVDELIAAHMAELRTAERPRGRYATEDEMYAAMEGEGIRPEAFGSYGMNPTEPSYLAARIGGLDEVSRIRSVYGASARERAAEVGHRARKDASLAETRSTIAASEAASEATSASDLTSSLSRFESAIQSGTTDAASLRRDFLNLLRRQGNRDDLDNLVLSEREDAVRRGLGITDEQLRISSTRPVGTTPTDIPENAGILDEFEASASMGMSRADRNVQRDQFLNYLENRLQGQSEQAGALNLTGRERTIAVQLNVSGEQIHAIETRLRNPTGVDVGVSGTRYRPQYSEHLIENAGSHHFSEAQAREAALHYLADINRHTFPVGYNSSQYELLRRFGIEFDDVVQRYNNIVSTRREERLAAVARTANQRPVSTRGMSQSELEGELEAFEEMVFADPTPLIGEQAANFRSEFLDYLVRSRYHTNPLDESGNIRFTAREQPIVNELGLTSEDIAAIGRRIIESRQRSLYEGIGEGSITPRQANEEAIIQGQQAAQAGRTGSIDQALDAGMVERASMTQHMRNVSRRASDRVNRWRNADATFNTNTLNNVILPARDKLTGKLLEPEGRIAQYVRKLNEKLEDPILSPLLSRAQKAEAVAKEKKMLESFAEPTGPADESGIGSLFAGEGVNAEREIRGFMQRIDDAPKGRSFKGSSSLSLDSWVGTGRFYDVKLRRGIINVEHEGYTTLSGSGFASGILPLELQLKEVNNIIVNLNKSIEVGKKIPYAYIEGNAIKTPQLKAVRKKYGGSVPIAQEGLNDNPYFGGAVEKEESAEIDLENLTIEDALGIYRSYIEGVYDGTDDEILAEQVYDKLNRVYHKEAKQQGMSVANYIMSNIKG